MSGFNCPFDRCNGISPSIRIVSALEEAAAYNWALTVIAKTSLRSVRAKNHATSAAMAATPRAVTIELRSNSRIEGSTVAAQRIALKLRPTRPSAQAQWTHVRARQGTNPPLPLKRSAPVSFKRMLGSMPKSCHSPAKD